MLESIIMLCKELDKEIARGQKAFEDVAKHLVEMGADNVTQVVLIDGFVVQIEAIITGKTDANG